jgi:hypothetical protein
MVFCVIVGAGLRKGGHYPPADGGVRDRAPALPSRAQRAADEVAGGFGDVRIAAGHLPKGYRTDDRTGEIKPARSRR